MTPAQRSEFAAKGARMAWKNRLARAQEAERKAKERLEQ